MRTDLAFAALAIIGLAFPLPVDATPSASADAPHAELVRVSGVKKRVPHLAGFSDKGIEKAVNDTIDEAMRAELRYAFGRRRGVERGDRIESQECG